MQDINQNSRPDKMARVDSSVIPNIGDREADQANIDAIDSLVTTDQYRHIVAWGKWLGFTPQTVLKHVKQAETDGAPDDVIQKIDGVWLRVSDICNESNRNRVTEIAVNRGRWTR